MITASLLMPACLAATPNCSEAEVYCAGLVTNLNSVTDKAFNQAAWEGMQQAKSEGLLDWVEYIESTDSRDYEKNIKVFAESGYDVIITVGESMGESTAGAASEYPDQYFIGIDQYQTWSTDSDSGNDLGNLTGLVFPEDQAGFLAGALAALMTQTGKVGAVCASDSFPHVWRYGEGFRSGATYIEPSLDIEVVYHNEASGGQTFNDPEWGASTTAGMIEAGTDIIFGVGDETGAGSIREASRCLCHRGGFRSIPARTGGCPQAADERDEIHHTGCD